MNKNSSVLIISPDGYYREELFNYLLASGYKEIQIADSIKNALPIVKEKHFSSVLIDISKEDLESLDYVYEAQKIAPNSKLILLIESQYQDLIDNKNRDKMNFEYVIKQFMLSNLLEILREKDN